MNTTTRQDIERKIVSAAVKGLLAKGYTLSVFDGEQVVLAKSDSKAAVLEAMFSTDEEDLYVYNRDGERTGSVRFVYGNDGWDVICDHSVCLEEALYEADELADKLADQYS